MNGLKIITLTAISIAAISAITPVLAEPLCSGMYAEVNIGPTRVTNISYGSGTNIQNSGAGININLGYKPIPYFAGEIGYTRYTTTKINIGNTQLATVTNYALDIAAKGILPIVDSNADIFAKLGGAYVNSNTSIKSSIASLFPNITAGKHTTTGFYFGAGGEYYLKDNIPVNLQWQRSVGDNQSGALDLYSVGIAFIFG